MKKPKQKRISDDKMRMCIIMPRKIVNRIDRIVVDCDLDNRSSAVRMLVNAGLEKLGVKK